MHEETYSAFFTPRDEEPSLSSSEEKSSEFDWLERKIARKQKYEGKTEQVLCKIYFFFLSITWLLSLRTSSRESIIWLWFKENYKTIYKGLFTLCSYLKTKESYDRWVTRRVWGFRHQISKAKNLKTSVANIGKLQKKFHSKRAAKFRSKRTTFSQRKVDFAVVQNSSFNLEWLASNGCNSFISTPNCALFESLDCWLPELWNGI